LLLLSSKGTKGSYDGGIWKIGDLASGEIVTLVLTTEVTKAGSIENIVVASTSTYDPNITNNEDNEKITSTQPSADLELIKVANKDFVKVGDKIVWTITVINHGPNKAVNAVVADILEGDIEVVSFKVSKGRFNVDNGIWTIGDLDVGERVTFTFTCIALSEGIVFNAAIVQSDTDDPDETNNEDFASVDVVDDGEPVPPIDGDTPNTPTPTPNSTPKMHATGNPVVMVILALLAAAGVGLRKRD